MVSELEPSWHYLLLRFTLEGSRLIKLDGARTRKRYDIIMLQNLRKTYITEMEAVFVIVPELGRYRAYNS